MQKNSLIFRLATSFLEIIRNTHPKKVCLISEPFYFRTKSEVAADIVSEIISYNLQRSIVRN